jgi:diaminohydroxyphosphoribosylaminopyrimidine deaminase/5-amino-6-(5-phosphoribosylamino)uracil reductase
MLSFRIASKSTHDRPSHHTMNDTDYIRRAIDLARRGTALTSPGAMVGAVIVKNDAIIGEGFYTYDGIEHAETIALRQAGNAARGSTIYTSLEPCAHRGRRPMSCALALVEARVARVVSAVEDPDPRVQGKGFAILREAGIAVECGLLEDEASRMNEAFLTQTREKRPFGILKIAMTLDGKIATGHGESQWITSEESRAAVQALRHSVDAVITGSGTFLKDKPQLTDRTGLPRRRELLRVVLDRRERVEKTPGWLLIRGGFDVLREELEQRQIQSFVLECGPDLAFSALENGIIDKIVTFIAPSILGGREVPAIGGAGIERLSDAIRLSDWTVTPGKPDITITAYVHGNH